MAGRRFGKGAASAIMAQDVTDAALVRHVEPRRDAGMRDLDWDQGAGLSKTVTFDEMGD